MDKPGMISHRNFINLDRQSHILSGKRIRVIILIGGCVLIALWQLSFVLNANKLDIKYRLKASSGLHSEKQFAYFYYYLGLYPITTERKNLVYNKEGARRIIDEQGNSLLMEIGHTLRHGDLGKMFLFLPDALLKGMPKNLSVLPFHRLAFIFALLFLFISFWWIGQPLLGIITVIFMGSNPFQLYEAHINENVFGWSISTALIILALHLPLLANRKQSPYYLLWIPILTGIILASIKQIRPEPVLIIVSAGLSYLAISKTQWRIKIALVLLLILSFYAASANWKFYFDNKFEEASMVVKTAGGHPYTGKREYYHSVWHTIWCGLGDFDKKYGYQWFDLAAAIYGTSILSENYNLNLPKWGSPQWTNPYHYNLFWDKAKKYYVKFSEMPHYFEVIRAKVIYDITHDPLWYINILWKRIQRVMSETTPVSLSLGQWRIPIYIHGIIIFPIMILLIVTRSWILLKLVCFSFPLSLTAILIYSGGNTTFYSCYHLFSAAIFVSWLFEAGFLWYKRIAER